MKDYLKEFEEALDKVVMPVLEDNWNDDFEGDDDDDDAGTGFTREAMFVQLGRILDSQGNPHPVDQVHTDDGKTINVDPMQAKVLRMLATTDKVKPIIRDQFIKDIQQSEGLGYFLQVDAKEMPQAFVKRYLK